MKKRGCLLSLILITVIIVPPCLFVVFGSLPAVMAEIAGMRKRGNPDLDLGLTIPFFVMAAGLLLAVAGLWTVYNKSHKQNTPDG